MKWIDAHCHLSDPRFDANLSEILERSRKAGVDAWFLGGTEPADWQRQVKLRQKHGPAMILSFGLHPWWAARFNEKQTTEALFLLEKEASGASAIGETGLDFMHRFEGTQARQTAAFVAQIELARKLEKPLVLHIVRAHEEALQILKKNGPFPRGGLIHAFGGSTELASRYLDLGFLISLGGSAKKDCLASLPLSAFVLETDAPDQLPRYLKLPAGTANEPEFLTRIATFASGLRDESVEKILDASSRNLRSMLGIP